jgi:hypothetical protein
MSEINYLREIPLEEYTKEQYISTIKSQREMLEKYVKALHKYEALSGIVRGKQEGNPFYVDMPYEKIEEILYNYDDVKWTDR